MTTLLQTAAQHGTAVEQARRLLAADRTAPTVRSPVDAQVTRSWLWSTS